MSTPSLDHLHVFIMAGGVGTRFWPESREAFPKQFLNLSDPDRSMIRCTVDRYLELIPIDRIYVITSDMYVDLVSEHIPELSHEHIIAEPRRRNTAPATLLGAYIAFREDEFAICHFAPSDAYIGQESVFRTCLQETVAFLTGHEGAITAIGMVPTHPHTGYGYIQIKEKGISPYKVERFTEKPDMAKAQAYLKSGEFLWNSGMYSFPAKYYIDLCEELAPHMAMPFRDLQWQTISLPDRKSFAELYNRLEDVSIDYLVAERAPSFYVFKGEFSWSDIGSWAALQEHLSQENEDIIQAESAIVEHTKGNLIRVSGNKLVVVRGLEGYAVIDTGETLMIYPLDKDQEIKQVRKKVGDEYGDQYI